MAVTVAGVGANTGTQSTTSTTSTSGTGTSSSNSTSGSSSGTGTLSAAGVGSGLDVKGLVTSLMTMEQRPLNLLVQQQIGLQAKLSNMGTVKSAIASLQSAAQALASASATNYSAASSDSIRLTVTAAADASLGSSSIDVTQLAQAQKLVASGKADMTSSLSSSATTTTTITFTLGTITGTPVNGIYPIAPDTSFKANPDKTSVSITIDSSNDSLAGIRDAINASAAGVKASIVNDGASVNGGTSVPYRLVLTPTDTGLANGMKIEVVGDTALQDLLAYDATTSTQNLTQVQAAQDAKITVDGVEIARGTNTISDVIPGITLNLINKNKSGDTPVTINVQRDTSTIKSALGALVKAYNDVNSTINGASAKGAVFQGDWTVLRLQSQIRSIFGESHQTGGAYTAFSQLGASFQKDGTLVLDSSKLSITLSANPEAVGALTAAVATGLNTATGQMLGASGSISSKTDNINSSITDMDSRRAQMQKRLDAVQKRYQTQFSALDVVISNMSKTSTFLTQQLANLPKIGNNN